MDRRSRCAAMLAACVSRLHSAADAYAYVTTDLNDWDISESTST